MRRITTLFFLACLFGLIAVAFSATKEEKPQHTLSAPAWEQVGRQALRQVNWDWRAALDRCNWIVRFHPGRHDLLTEENSTIIGITTLPECRIDIWIYPARSSKKVAATIVHELAHAFDYDYLTSDLRKAWLVARNLSPSTPWWPPCPHCDDYRFGAGDFAECVKWTLQGSTDKFRSLLGPLPNETQQALIRKWLAELPRTIQTGGK
jgi:hypothetical protein